jgi:hypothetical protein
MLVAVRIFASLATIAVLLQRLGYPHFDVDVTEYVRGRVRAAQPLRSASMKRGRLPEASSRARDLQNAQTGHTNAD